MKRQLDQARIKAGEARQRALEAAEGLKAATQPARLSMPTPAPSTVVLIADRA